MVHDFIYLFSKSRSQVSGGRPELAAIFSDADNSSRHFIHWHDVKSTILYRILLDKLAKVYSFKFLEKTTQIVAIVCSNDRYCTHQQLFAHICVCVGNNEMLLLNEAAISPRSNALSNSCGSPVIVCAQSIGHLPPGPRNDVKTVSSMSNQAGCNLLSFFTTPLSAQQVTSFWMRSRGLATSP